MGKRRAARDERRTREFAAFVAGAGGRLLHVAALLTAEPPQRCVTAERLLTAALAGTYARWDQLRGEDPYERTRQELTARFAHSAWRHRRPGPLGHGPLAALTPQERLVLVLRLHEGVAEEVTAATLGLPPDRVRAVCARAIAVLRDPDRDPDRDRPRDQRAGAVPGSRAAEGRGP
ncbi:sigma factor-like helix-turn-helix DNA-binding protein [Streptomyces buecherae]|uniref:RNA polymerase subunit sigma-70 n=1 Tax=Streptomyces buecherae TaxID=2763006 RepID=A0A7H8NC75_9ACTN|nr:sigma factor-like helix-turn-helix DNA-binding protein [Streptomyces buecherae]QKW52024.1 RNA polymerase subunit sigma-70 [Streptomyces buecherae]